MEVYIITISDYVKKRKDRFETKLFRTREEAQKEFDAAVKEVLDEINKNIKNYTIRTSEGYFKSYYRRNQHIDHCTIMLERKEV